MPETRKITPADALRAAGLDPAAIVMALESAIQRETTLAREAEQFGQIHNPERIKTLRTELKKLSR